MAECTLDAQQLQALLKQQLPEVANNAGNTQIVYVVVKGNDTSLSLTPPDATQQQQQQPPVAAGPTSVGATPQAATALQTTPSFQLRGALLPPPPPPMAMPHTWQHRGGYSGGSGPPIPRGIPPPPQWGHGGGGGPPFGGQVPSTVQQLAQMSGGQPGPFTVAVVDPMTRKLLIPASSVFPTRAQQRASIPSLCQLFLQGRCRQGFNCHQVHAEASMIQRLRQQVHSLPTCCIEHGDHDFTTAGGADGVADDRVVLVQNVAWNDGLIPIRFFSFTRGLGSVLQTNQTTSFRNQDAIVAYGSEAATICRLHVLDRCRYAEECKFLHVCKQVLQNDPSFAMPEGIKGGGVYWSTAQWKPGVM